MGDEEGGREGECDEDNQEEVTTEEEVITEDEEAKIVKLFAFRLALTRVVAAA